MITLLKDLFAFYRSTEARWFLYISIAFLTVVIDDLSGYTNFHEIPKLKLCIICLSACIQSLIAWRAFIDQAISRDEAAGTSTSILPPLSGS